MFLLRQIPVVSSLLPALAPLGPQVAVIALNGVISRPSGNPLQDRGSFNIEKLRKWADAAFALKNVQAVALDINCPGGCMPCCNQFIPALKQLNSMPMALPWTMAQQWQRRC